MEGMENFPGKGKAHKKDPEERVLYFRSRQFITM